MAIRTERLALVDALVDAGADPSATNEKGISPLLLAGEMGSLAVTKRLIQAGANPNDGSLHQAARTMQTKVVKALLQHGANPNYRSGLHGGRTVLAEICLVAKVTTSIYQAAVEFLTELQRKGAAIEERSERRPLICMALDNQDPVMVVQAFMAACLPNNRVDEDFNLYEENGMVYSPTYYVSKGLSRGPRALSQEVVQLPRRYGANRDVYYSLTGPQPRDAKGMPASIAEKERLRIESEKRIAEEEAEHRRRMQRADGEEARRLKIEQQRHALAYKHNQEVGLQRLEQVRQLSEVQRAQRQNHLETEQWLQDLRLRGDQERLRLRQSQNVIEEADRQRLLQMETLAIGEGKNLEVENRRCLEDIKQQAIEYKAEVQDGLPEKAHERRLDQFALEAEMSQRQLEWSEPNGGGYIEGPLD